MTSGSPPEAPTTADAELARLALAEARMPAVAGRYDQVLKRPDAPTRLWQAACAEVRGGHFDDRALYWARLKLRRRLLRMPGALSAERLSRGFDGGFAGAERRVLITGFDPFHLDRNIQQSNPSGLIALALDNTTLVGTRIRTAILPVRFADFDAGIVESLFRPFFSQGLTLALTISMGRDHFDLERFPGRRRSAETPDNCGAHGGGTPTAPVPPSGADGPEFLEFSLPAEQMTAVQGRWRVNDNRNVCTLQRGEITARTLAALADETAVRGSGGGYLSNEIAYRSLLLQKQLGARFPLGHIHTPAIKGYDATLEKDIVDQARAMIATALRAIGA